MGVLVVESFRVLTLVGGRIQGLGNVEGGIMGELRDELSASQIQLKGVIREYGWCEKNSESVIMSQSDDRGHFIWMDRSR